MDWFPNLVDYCGFLDFYKFMSVIKKIISDLRFFIFWDDTIAREKFEFFMVEKFSNIQTYNADHLSNHDIEKIEKCGQELIIHHSSIVKKENHQTSKYGAFGNSQWNC